MEAKSLSASCKNTRKEMTGKTSLFTLLPALPCFKTPFLTLFSPSVSSPSSLKGILCLSDNSPHCKAFLLPPGLCLHYSPIHNVLFLHMSPVSTLNSELKTFSVQYLTYTHCKWCCLVLRVSLILVTLITFRQFALFPNSPDPCLSLIHL